MSTDTSVGTISSLDQFDDTPAGEALRWQQEMAASHKELQKFHKTGSKVVDRFLDERKNQISSEESKLNIFWSGVTLMQDMLFGQVPQVDVKRRFSDQDDDVARVAGEMLERVLNTEIESDTDTFGDAIALTLNDRLIPGLGQARVRYEAEFETQMTPPMMDPTGMFELAPGVEQEVKTHEDCVIDYVHWRDFAWSPCRTWGECRWVAFRAYMTKDEVKKRFGDEYGDKVQFNVNTRRNETRVGLDADPWQRGEVWEIWDKESNKVIWWSKGVDELLDKQDDPLGLERFWPCPKPFVANLTTTKFIPKADYTMVQDQYSEIDILTTRIALLESAIKVVGVYDSGSTGVQKMLEGGAENQLYPVDNWALFAEKGGIKGQVDWMPIEQIAVVIDKLRDVRREIIEILDQLTGLSDIVRGQASAGPARTATEQSIKGRFSSARMQSLQDQTTEFAADLQRLKAEVIAKHFDPAAIVQRSNVLSTPDADMAQPAVELIQSEFAQYKIMIQSEAMAMSDYAAMQSERSNFLTGLSTFLTAAAPLVMQAPMTTPFLLEMLKWAMSGFRGAAQIEGVMDQAIEAAQKPPEEGEEKPDPKVEAEKAKIQGKMAADQAKFQQKMQELQAKAQAEMQKIQTEMHADMQKLQAETRAAGIQEQQQAYWNMQEQEKKAQLKAQEEATKATFGVASAKQIAKLKPVGGKK